VSKSTAELHRSFAQLAADYVDCLFEACQTVELPAKQGRRISGAAIGKMIGGDPDQNLNRVTPSTSPASRPDAML
jgi:hypothetical protein